MQLVLVKLYWRKFFTSPGRQTIQRVPRSIAINHLQELFKAHDDAAVVFIYCNYKMHYNVLQLLEALLKQLAFYHLTSGSIELLQKKHKERGCRPSLDTLTKLLETEIQTYSRIFIVVDALDECFPEHVQEGFLAKLRSLTVDSTAKLMVTSRYIPSIELAIHADIRLEIIAMESDIISHVEARILENSMLKRLVTKPPSLEEKVVGTVVEKAQGMYVRADSCRYRRSHNLTGFF
jgi:hypothetical protein